MIKNAILDDKSITKLRKRKTDFLTLREFIGLGNYYPISETARQEVLFLVIITAVLVFLTG